MESRRGLGDLPLEVKLEILGHLERAEVLLFRRVSKRWGRFVVKASSFGWVVRPPSDLHKDRRLCSPTGRCCAHIFESLEQQLDTLLTPVDRYDGGEVANRIIHLWLKLPYTSKVTGRRWITWLQLFAVALEAGQFPRLQSFTFQVGDWYGENPSPSDDLEEERALIGPLVELMEQRRIGFEFSHDMEL